MKVLFTSCLFLLLVLIGIPDARPQITIEQVVYGKSNDLVFDSPSGIFYDCRKNEVYITDSGSSNVLIFDSFGGFLFSFPHWVRRGEEELPGEPRAVVVSTSGVMYLTDALSQEIDVLNPRGIRIDRILPGSFEPFEGKTVYPQYMAIDQSDTLFVTLDGDSKEILVLDPRHRLSRRIKGPGVAFGFLTGIALTEDGNLVVTDAGAQTCVKVLSRTGQLLKEFGAKEIGDENFSHPHGVACTGDGDIWVVDSFRQVLKRFTRDGTFKEMVGGFGTGPGEMQYPMGITSDGSDLLGVIEKVGRRFQLLRVEEPAAQDLEEQVQER